MCIDIIYGKGFKPKTVKINFMRYIVAYVRSLKIRAIYKKMGLKETVKYINKFSCNKVLCLEKQNAVYNARRIVSLSNRISKILSLSDNCLENSLALSTILLSLGYEHSLLIGKHRNYMGGDYIFHAWLEIDGTCVNGIVGTKEMLIVVHKNNFCLKGK